MNDNRRRILLVAGLGGLLLLGGLAYFLWAVDRVEGDIAQREEDALRTVEDYEALGRELPTSTPVPVDVVPPLGQPGDVLVINRIPGDDYGRLAIRHPDSTRTLLDKTCMRVDVSAGHGLCLSEEGGIVPKYRATYFDATTVALTTLKTYDVSLPSRARLSPDGSLATSTSFVDGLSYDDIGSSNTTTNVLIDDFGAATNLIGVGQFEVASSDRKYNDSERQFWGLTFADNDEFYVTGFFAGEVELLRGSIAERELTPLGLSGSCPSLSPDGSTLVYKQAKDAGGFDLIALNLESQESWMLGETRSVDDQVAWLDDETLLYALHPEGTESNVQPQFDIWQLAIAEGSEPELFLPFADSPSVIN